MSYTFTEHTGTGSQVTFPFTFAGRDKGYLRASDITVEVQGTDGEWTATTGWSLNGTNQVTFLTAPALGLKLRIRRVVEKDYPYAEFDRGVTLDMRSLNNSFIHLLEISQELLDGFYPTGFFIKQNVSWGMNRIINLGDGKDPYDAVNKGQLDVVNNTQTAWNTRQDLDIAGLKSAMTSGIAQRTIPWFFDAVGGETIINPPYLFDDALVFINGVLQHQLGGAFSITNSIINLAEPLEAGDQVYVLIGSRIATSAPGANISWSQAVPDGTTTVNVGQVPAIMSVYIDGLFQPKSSYSVLGTVITFTEALPACTVSAEFTT